MSASLPSASSFDDPRIDPRYLRYVPDDSGDVLLVGVVHDHPASVARARIVLENARPDVLALELPSVALELYRVYAREESAPPRFGGEMSAAIQAADTETVVGIDAPNTSYVRRLFARLIADRARLTTAKRVVSGLGSATREAVASRLAATLTDATSMTVAPTDRIEYAVDHGDTPTRQANHERAHVAGVQALLAATSGDTLSYRDETREACMIDRLEELRRGGDVVAIVGLDHLDALEAGLDQ